MEGTIAQIIMFAGNFAPKYWAICQGQLLPIAQNQALFALLGTTYGGNGQTTFALPDLRGRVPVGFGQGPGLSPIALGERAGTETVTLTTAQMPAHNHTATSTLNAVSENGTTGTPSGNYLAATGSLDPDYATSGTAVAMANGSISTAIGITGSSQAHENRQPYLVMNYIICTQGIFPSRN